jgi:hypothetical protein
MEEKERQRAKTLIQEYLEEEFGQSSVDLSEEIGLAFTTLNNPDLFRKRGIVDFDQEVEVQVSCKVEERLVTTYVNNVPLRLERYDSLTEMNDNFLSSLSFEGLIYMSSFDWECIAGILLKEQDRGRKEEIA